MGTKESMKQKLLITERKILRWIFRPTKDRNVTWRIKTIDELNNLIRNKTIDELNNLIRNKNIFNALRPKD
jgi:hypothetical protein